MKIPASWSQVTLRDYISIATLSEEEPDYYIQLIATLSGATLNEVERLPVSEYRRAVQALQFLKKQPKDKVKVRIKVKGREFHACLYTHQLTTGQYTDLMAYCKDPKKITENLPKIMAAFCLPVKRRWWGWKYVAKYEGEEVLPRAEFFEENMTMNQVFPMSDFFLQTLKNLIPAIQIYLEREMIRLKNHQKKMMKKESSLKNGVG